MKYLFTLILTIIFFICDAQGVKTFSKIENPTEFIIASTKFSTKDSCTYFYSNNDSINDGNLRFRDNYMISWTNYMNEERAKFNFENNVKLRKDIDKAEVVKEFNCYILGQKTKAIKLKYRTNNETADRIEIWSYLSYKNQYLMFFAFSSNNDNELNSNKDLTETVVQFFRFKK